jgi:hypothetical protein
MAVGQCSAIPPTGTKIGYLLRVSAALAGIVGVVAGGVLALLVSAWQIGRNNRSRRYHEQWQLVLTAYRDFAHHIEVLGALPAQSRDSPSGNRAYEGARKALSDLTLLDPWPNDRVEELAYILERVTRTSGLPPASVIELQASVRNLFASFQHDVATKQWTEVRGKLPASVSGVGRLSREREMHMDANKVRGTTLYNTPLILGAVVTLLALGLFLACGAETGDWYRALGVVELRRDPSGPLAGVTVPLSIMGYLLIPTFIALIVTSSVQAFVTKRTVTRAELDRRLFELRDDGIQVSGETAANQSHERDDSDPV